MKVKLFVSSILLSTSLQVHAGILDNILKDVFGDVLSYFDIGGVEAGDFFHALQEEAVGNLAGQIGEGAGSVMDTCYVYSPSSSPVYGSKININVCSVMNSLPNLCDSAPDLGSYGYRKKNPKWDLKNACKNIMGNKQTIKISDYIPNANMNIELFNMDTSNKSSVIGGKIRYAFSETNNKHYIAALKDGDYETLTIYNNILNTSNATSPDDIDISKINVAYSTIDEYSKSVEERVDAFRTLEDQLNISRVKKLAYDTFIGINKKHPLTENFSSQTSRENEKISAKSKILEDYEKLVDKFVKMNIKDRMLLEYRPGVLNPTKETVDNRPEEERARVVYVIEKQKAIQANIIRQERRKGDTLTKRAKREITRVMYATEELNEKATMKNIQALVK